MGRLMRLINEAYDMPEIHGNSVWLVRDASYMGCPVPRVKGGDSDVIGGCVATVDEQLKMTVCTKKHESLFGCFCGAPDSMDRMFKFKKSDDNTGKFSKGGFDAIQIRTFSRRKDLAPSENPEQTYKADDPMETIEHEADEE